jgi:hypothetical protein
MSRLRRLALGAAGLAAFVVLVAVVSPRIGGIEARGTQVAAQIGAELARDKIPIACETKAAVESATTQQDTVELYAALRACREREDRSHALVAVDRGFERAPARLITAVVAARADARERALP